MIKCFVCNKNFKKSSNLDDQSYHWYDSRDKTVIFEVCNDCFHNNTNNFLDKKVAPLYEATLKPKTSSIDPNYYKWHPKVECKEVISEFPFNLASVIKYIWRVASPDARKYDSVEGQVEDLRKAIQYLEFEIDRIQARQTAINPSSGVTVK